jgi:hypothetical protein
MVMTHIRDNLNINLSDCMWVVDDHNMHSVKMCVKEVTSDWKCKLLILPIASSPLMACEFVFNITKN